MKRILFMRKFERRHGGHITFRDFFEHSMDHPRLDPYVYFTPDSNMADNDAWKRIPADRFVTDLKPLDYDAVVVGSSNWRFLPKDVGNLQVISLCLHVRHAKKPYLRKCLERPAFRIADAQEVYDAIKPFANGPVEVIHEALDGDLFTNTEPKRSGSVFIFGQKAPRVATEIADLLTKDGIDVTLVNDSIPQGEFAALMRRSEIFVALPHRREGFYRPPIEAMAAGCAVVCSDAVGSRVHLKKDETCLQPEYGDSEGYARDVLRLLHDRQLRDRLVANGGEMAARFSWAHQRALYHDFVDRHLFAADLKANEPTATRQS